MEIRNNKLTIGVEFKRCDECKRFDSKEAQWDCNLANLNAGVLGAPTHPESLLRYWKAQELAGYPSASENVKYFESRLKALEWDESGPDTVCPVCGFSCGDPFYLGEAHFCPECGVALKRPKRD